MFVSILEYLPFLRSAMWLLSLSGGHSFFWNSDTKRFQLRELKSYSAFASISACAMIFVTVTMRIGAVLVGAGAIIHHITSLLIYIGTTTAYFMGIVAFLRADEIVVCFNSLIQIEEKVKAEDPGAGKCI